MRSIGSLDVVVRLFGGLGRGLASGAVGWRLLGVEGQDRQQAGPGQGQGGRKESLHGGGSPVGMKANGLLYRHGHRIEAGENGSRRSIESDIVVGHAEVSRGWGPGCSNLFGAALQPLIVSRRRHYRNAAVTRYARIADAGLLRVLNSKSDKLLASARGSAPDRLFSVDAKNRSGA